MPDIDEDILRQLMTRATEDLYAPQAAAAQALRRHRRHRARVRVTTVAGTAAAAGLAAGVLLPGTGGGARPSAPGAASSGNGAYGTAHVRLTAAQRELFSLSAAAAATPRADGRYVVLTEQTTSIDSGGPSGAVRETGPKTSVIDTITGGGVTYQGITVTNANGTPTPPSVLRAADGTSPTRAQLDAWPTGTAALRAALLAQARQQIAQARQFMEQKVRAEEKQLGKKLTTPSQPRLSDDDLVFEQAADMLWQPDLSPALRSALYKVLAATPGVKVQAGAADSSGRPATLISRRADSGGYTVRTYEKPDTGATLESAWAGPGTSFDEDLYQHIGYTDTIPANPYKA
jgi:hypothetical protein